MCLFFILLFNTIIPHPFVLPKEPEAPAQPDWAPLKQKKPSLSIEHMKYVAELVEKYLPSDAIEFSEDDSLSKLHLLWQMTKKLLRISQKKADASSWHRT